MKWKIIVIGVNASIIDRKDTIISIGNAAADNSILVPPQNVDINKLLRKVRNIEYWNGNPVNVSAFIKNYYYEPME